MTELAPELRNKAKKMSAPRTTHAARQKLQKYPARERRETKAVSAPGAVAEPAHQPLLSPDVVELAESLRDDGISVPVFTGTVRAIDLVLITGAALASHA